MSNQGGGQPGNSSALIHGSRTPRFGMVLADLGSKYPAIYRDIRKLRSVLEQQKTEPNRTLPVATVARINQICRWELTARIAQWMVAHGSLEPAETLSALNTMTHATRQRDSLITRLGLDGDAPATGPDPWAALDAQRAQRQAAEARGESEVNPAATATDVVVGDVGGDTDG